MTTSDLLTDGAVGAAGPVDFAAFLQGLADQRNNVGDPWATAVAFV